MRTREEGAEERDGDRERERWVPRTGEVGRRVLVDDDFLFARKRLFCCSQNRQPALLVETALASRVQAAGTKARPREREEGTGTRANASRPIAGRRRFSDFRSLSRVSGASRSRCCCCCRCCCRCCEREQLHDRETEQKKPLAYAVANGLVRQKEKKKLSSSFSRDPLPPPPAPPYLCLTLLYPPPPLTRLPLSLPNEHLPGE